MKRVILIRHGKTLANEKRLYCGFGDSPLSEAGIKEIESLKHLYEDVGKNAVFINSGLSRTVQTMEILFNTKGLSYAGLKEMNFGDFEFQSYEQLKDRPDYQNWLEDTINNKVPSGESFIEMRKRVIDTYNEIIDKFKEYDDIVIVCHGGTIFHIIDYLFDEHKYIYEIQPENGHSYVIDYTNSKLKYEIR